MHAMRLRLPSTLVTFAGVLSLASSAFAQTPPRSRPAADPARDRPVLQAMFDQPRLDPARFSSGFTDAVPLANVQAAIDTYRASLGALQSIVPAGPDELLTFARGTLRASTAYDGSGKLTGLLFHDEISAANRTALERLLRASKGDPAWFSAQFISHVGADQIAGLLDRLHATAGTFERVEIRNGGYVSVFSKGAYPTIVSTDASGKIDNLAFRAPDNASPAP